MEVVRLLVVPATGDPERHGVLVGAADEVVGLVRVEDREVRRQVGAVLLADGELDAPALVEQRALDDVAPEKLGRAAEEAADAAAAGWT